MDLKNKIVVITGGSRGFGKALAKTFHAEGSNVIIASHEESELKKTSQELSVDSHLTDVTAAQAMENLGAYVINKYGAIDIWINNAGIQIAPSLAEEVVIEKLRHLFDVNFFGYIHGCQTALRLMKKQNRGIIINVNSTAGLEGKAGLSAYCSSKFAIRGMTETIRKEIADTKIKIYAIYPGGMQTDIYKEKYPDDIKEYMTAESVAEKVMSSLKSDNPKQDLIIKRPKK
ncbi:MAG: SDR family oxidoreductase [Patescibacteria group bacterium]|jgi:NAD(P)-dependent dehydrogenase (short-subunit alcohol dehydrogenase family)